MKCVRLQFDAFEQCVHDWPISRDFGLNGFGTDVLVGLDVGAADQVDAIGHGGENAVHDATLPSGVPQSLECLGDRSRLARQIENQRRMVASVSRRTPTWRDRIAVGTNSSEMRRICSPKPGISRVATARVASGVTSRRAGSGAAGGQHQVATDVVDQFDQCLLDAARSIGNQSLMRLQTVT